jgi:hypothetical protein
MIFPYRRRLESNEVTTLDHHYNDCYSEDLASFISHRSVTSTQHENSDMFERLCVEAEVEDMANIRRFHPTTRRGSLQPTFYYNEDNSRFLMDDKNFHHRLRRRHSTYDVRNRAAHIEEHHEMEEYIRTRRDDSLDEQLIFIQNLQYLTNGLTLLKEFPDSDRYSTATSSPYTILKYMMDFDDFDDDDDFIRLEQFKRKKFDSQSISSDSQELVEHQMGDMVSPQDNHHVEYVINLSPLISEEMKPNFEKTRRKVPSYQILKKEMELQPVHTVFQSMIHPCQKRFPTATDSTATATAVMMTTNSTLSCPKVHDNNFKESCPMNNKPNMLTHIQCARGA